MTPTTPPVATSREMRSLGDTACEFPLVKQPVTPAPTETAIVVAAKAALHAADRRIVYVAVARSVLVVTLMCKLRTKPLRDTTQLSRSSLTLTAPKPTYVVTPAAILTAAA